MKVTQHLTTSVFRRYNILVEAQVTEAQEALYSNPEQLPEPTVLEIKKASEGR